MSGVYLPPESQDRLLRVARQTLESCARGLPPPFANIDDPYLSAVAYGAFVTLRRQEALRGCVGMCVPTRPLFQTVAEMTVAAASRDHRVRPIDPQELDRIHIDISVLSGLELARDPLCLEIGRHGLHIATEKNTGVLLPQVATQQGWDIRVFLEQTCVKAGLAKDAWQHYRTRVSSFTALVLEEAR